MKKLILILMLIAGFAGAATIQSTGGGGTSSLASGTTALTGGTAGGVCSDQSDTLTCADACTINETTNVMTCSVLAFGADPADAGEIRLSNGGCIESEASPAGTDMAVCTTAGEYWNFATGSAGINLPVGTKTLPAITAGDADSGIYFLANGQGVSFSINDFTALAITSATATFGVDPIYNADNGGNIGSAAAAWRTIFIKTSIQSANSKALTDNTPTSFVKVTVAAGSYEAGTVDFTGYCKDANDQVVRAGSIPFAAQNTGGTVTCAVGTPTSSGDVTNNAKAFSTFTFTCADGTANTVSLLLQADCSITTPTVETIEYRVNITSGTATVTPQ